VHFRGAHKDRLEIKRMGSSNVEASITLEQDFMPTAYALDPRLAEVRPANRMSSWHFVILLCNLCVLF
jgi:hypothetical protein